MMNSEDLVGCLIVVARFEDYTWGGGTSRAPFGALLVLSPSVLSGCTI